MRKAVFLDRDGVINRKSPEGHYVTRKEEMFFLPGVARAISMLNRAGFRVILATNQRCIAKGLLTPRRLARLHQWMCRQLAMKSGAVIDAVYYCPHDKVPACGCRKPAPGMLFAAARDHRIRLSASWMIGDSAGDMAAGKTAGCKTVFISARGRSTDAADFSAPSLLRAAKKILSMEARRRKRSSQPVARRLAVRARITARSGS
jgi:D-glycero-D-manno-heptose 1,7-bisphosphate phosphatase